MSTGNASQAENPPLVRVRLNRLLGICLCFGFGFVLVFCLRLCSLLASFFVRDEPSSHAVAVTSEQPVNCGLCCATFTSDLRHQPERRSSFRAGGLPSIELPSHAFTWSSEQPFDGDLRSQFTSDPHHPPDRGSSFRATPCRCCSSSVARRCTVLCCRRRTLRDDIMPPQPRR